MLQILLRLLLQLQTILILMDQNLLDILVHFDFQEPSNQEQNNHHDYHIFETLNHLLLQLNYRKLLAELSQHMNHH